MYTEGIGYGLSTVLVQVIRSFCQSIEEVPNTAGHSFGNITMPPKRKPAAKKAATAKAGSATRAGRVAEQAREVPPPPPVAAPRQTRAAAKRKRDQDGDEGEAALPPPPAKLSRKEPAVRRKRKTTVTVTRDDGDDSSAADPVADEAPGTEEVIDHVMTDEFRDEIALAQVGEQYDVVLNHKKVVRGKTVAGTPEDARMHVTLKVHRDPAEEFDSRLGYHANISLERPDEKSEEPVIEQIGYIHSWRIDKPNRRTRNPKAKTRWKNDFLRKNPHKRFPPAGSETAGCLQALFTKAGLVKPELEDQSNILDDEPLIFLQMIYLFPQFQGKGLLRDVLTGFHELLFKLPEWYSFDGPVVLVPAAPDGVRGQSWNAKSDQQLEDVERTLARAYTTHGGYTVWVRDQVVYSKGVTVMGRRQSETDPDV